MAGKVLQHREQHTLYRAIKRRDIHGRIWNCQFHVDDEKSGNAGTPMLDGQYSPPIDIPLKYLKHTNPDDPFLQPIDFAQWKMDWRERMRTWRERLAMIAKAMYPNDWGAHVASPTPQMIEEAGARPIPLQFIEAIEVGNKWALGTPKPDGTYYPRPSWATDELWGQYMLLRQSFWLVDGDKAFPEPTPDQYPDEGDEEAAEVESVDEDEENEPPRRKGRRVA